jgi:hypothetical protein
VRDDEHFGSARWPQNLELTIEDDEERKDLVSDFYERIAARNGAAASMRLDSRNLRVRQRREQVIVNR